MSLILKHSASLTELWLIQAYLTYSITCISKSYKQIKKLQVILFYKGLWKPCDGF